MDDLGYLRNMALTRCSEFSIREVQSLDTALSFTLSYVRIAYFAHISRIRRCSMHHASRCSDARVEATGEKKDKREQHTRSDEGTKERDCKGRLKVGAPFVVGRCFRLRRPCRLINNTISLFLRVFLSFSSASVSSSSDSGLLPPLPGRYLAARKPN